MLRILQILVVISVALFWTLVVFNNLTDFESNRIYIQRVMSLDTIQNEVISWRAVTNTPTQFLVYCFFILWETLTLCVCWFGAYQMIKHIKVNSYSRVKMIAVLGIMMGFFQYMFGFVDIASEWFYVWQSELKEAQIKAVLFSSLMILCALFVTTE